MTSCVDNTKILKEGVLHRYEKTQSRFLKKEDWKTKDYYVELQEQSSAIKSLICNFYTCKDNKRGSQLKEKVEMTAPHQISKSSSVGLEKHKYDNYVCITPANGPIVFLSFNSKSERDDWHDTIVSALRTLNIPIKSDSSSDEELTPHRPRVNTEPNKDLVKRRDSPTGTIRDVKTDPVGSAAGFRNVLDEMKTKTKTQMKPKIDVDSGKTENVNPCCIRNHVVAYHHDGRNMIFHPENHYENIHHVQSENDWHKEIHQKRSTVKLHHNVYNDFHNLSVIQTPQPSTNEAPRWPKQRHPSFTTDSAQESTAQNTTDNAVLGAGNVVEEEPRYMNMRRSDRRRPVAVEDDERYPPGCPRHQYINDDIRSMNSTASSIRHPSPPPPPLPERQNSAKKLRAPLETRRASMKDRPLPRVPQGMAEGEAKVTKMSPTKPTNDYSVPPTRHLDREQIPHRKAPLLPPEKGEKLKRAQCQLRDEMSQKNGAIMTFRKKDVVAGKVDLAEWNDNIIIAGWDPANASLTRNLHIGDILTMVNQQMLSSATFAHQTMNLTAQDQVSLKLKRIQYGTLVIIHKEQPGQSLGITLNGNEITNILPNGLLIRQGQIRPQTPGLVYPGVLCNYAITEINMRPVGFNSTTEQVNEMLRMAGSDISLVLHPVDFIQVLKSDTQRRFSFS